jgi:hypothetical protein
LVASLARLGGSITGFALIEFEIIAKWLEGRPRRSQSCAGVPPRQTVVCGVMSCDLSFLICIKSGL